MTTNSEVPATPESGSIRYQVEGVMHTLFADGTDVADTVVNHPPHYNQHPSGVECISIAEHFNFNLGNAIKYIWRAGQKESQPTIQDLEKARWYLDREISRITNAEDPAQTKLSLDQV